MNHRLLTPAEKQLNCSARKRREAVRERLARRSALIENLARHGISEPQIFSSVKPEGALKLLIGHGHSANRVARQLGRDAGLRIGKAAFPRTRLNLQIPARRLRHGWKSEIIVRPDVPDSLRSGAVALEVALNRVADLAMLGHNEDAIRMLGTMTNVNFAAAAEMLATSCGVNVLPSAVENAKQVARFWELYRCGRRIYQAEIAHENLVGDLALFSADQLGLLLPGLSVPRQLTRYYYLTNLRREFDGQFEIEVFSYPGLRGLFRHPLRTS